MSGFGFPRNTANFDQNNFFAVTKTTGISGIATEIYNFTIPSTQTYLLSSLYLSCRMTGCLILSLDSAAIFSARNSAARPDVQHYFVPEKKLNPGQIITATFQIQSGLSSSDVDFHLSGIKKTI